MDAVSMGVGVGGAVSSSYYRSLGDSERRAEKFGKRWEETNRKAMAVGDLVRYRRSLESLRRKQAEVGASNTRVARGIADLERRYRESEARRQVLRNRGGRRRSGASGAGVAEVTPPPVVESPDETSGRET